MATTSSPTGSFDARSGHGPASVIPEEIKRWSWGAFLLTFIWGIKHRVWMSLLVFVPVVNVVAPFILGHKGNELAWREKSWPSVDAFHATQRKWAMAGLIVIGAMVALSVGSVVLVLMFGKPVTAPSDMATDAFGQKLDSGFMETTEVVEGGPWVTYVSPEEDFKVDFPSTPDTKTGSYEIENGETVATTLLQAEEGPTVYLVAIEEFPNPLPTVESDAIDQLRASLQRVAQSIEGAMVASTEPTSFMGAPALRYTMQYGTERMEEGMFVMKGKRIYTVSAEYDTGSKPAAFDTFQSSFELK